MGAAVAGDNCTPFNSYKVGYSTPSGRIVQQTVLLADGWNLVGWIIDEDSGTRLFAPYEPFFDGVMRDVRGAGPPTLYPTGRGAELGRGYAAHVRWRNANGLTTVAPSALPSTTLVAPCFATPMQP